MFESTPVNPPDAIFGLNEEFKRDPNPDKINLTVGMYQDETGKTPIMNCVRKAEQILLDSCTSHVYLPIGGMNEYNQVIPGLIFGETHDAVSQRRVHSVQTPGGTGALRVAGDLLSRNYGVKTIWVSNPTWSNHLNIFPAAGLKTVPYHYLDDAGKSLDFDRFLASIEQMNAGDAILLHTVCHNPTGVDPSVEQWQQVISAVKNRRLIPIFDFAYQGFGASVEQDSFAIREFCSDNSEALICNSFSKNFNLYGERVGAITMVATSEEAAKAVLSQVKAVIRAIYSNPPTHGAAIVSTVFADETLKREWREELESIRIRIGKLREQFVNAIRQRLPDMDFDHILRQRGMFSYSGISGDAAERLKLERSIYLLKSGRINIAGINDNNIDRLCDAIATVIHQPS